METKSGKPLFPIGIGTWMMGGDWDAISRKSTPNFENDDREIEAIRYCLELGQNHIDTAEMYGAGHTDEIVGNAIDGKVREDIYVADKLWHTSFSHDGVFESVELMLQRLKTSYIDLLYIHSTFDDSKWEDVIKPINSLIDQGVVRDFGVSNFSVENMKRANELSNHLIVANQMHYNCVFKSEVTPEFEDYCKDNSIEIVAYQPVERGSLLTHKVVCKIAEKHKATPAQIAILWLICRGIHAIPKASKKEHIDENFSSSRIELDADDFEQLGDI